jgi:hypothetical protein
VSAEIETRVPAALAAAEVLDPVGTDRTMPTDR